MQIKSKNMLKDVNDQSYSRKRLTTKITLGLLKNYFIKKSVPKVNFLIPEGFIANVYF